MNLVESLNRRFPGCDGFCPSFLLPCCDARPLGLGLDLDLLKPAEPKRVFHLLHVFLQKTGEDYRPVFFKAALEMRQEFHESVAREVGHEDRKNIVPLGKRF